MIALTDDALVDQAVKFFKLACLEKDWDVAEFFCTLWKRLQIAKAMMGWWNLPTANCWRSAPIVSASDRTPFA